MKFTDVEFKAKERGYSLERSPKSKMGYVTSGFIVRSPHSDTWRRFPTLKAASQWLERIRGE